MLKDNFDKVLGEINGAAKLIAVSKKKPATTVLEAYDYGQRDFGENYVQELAEKAASLPTDIRWHQIGYLQSNKVKYIAPFVYSIHSVHSEKLAKEINKQARKNNRVISCLLQVHIAEEDSKSGFDENELLEFIESGRLESYENIEIHGLMGMATFTSDTDQIEQEFKGLQAIFEKIKTLDLPANIKMEELSMGMSSDWQLAIKYGSTMLRIGSALFGSRD